ncbi:hypothetical protein [Halorarum halobium]|uniref:hypothetical protein n=1 Tax=Halorarum halobium TaxID=3075121 RepID=UPI0028A6B0F0|nr:hypothetical protein [Halobaculum sp. XH14]
MKRSGSRPLQFVGVVAAAMAVVGSVAFGWEFGGPTGTVPFVLGVGFVVVAVGWTVLRGA